MATIEHNGTTYSVDEYGFLFNGEEWDENWVDYVKSVEGITEITDEHWKVIDIIREYYKKNGVPTIRLMNYITFYSSSRIYEFFPRTGHVGACKMAGFPRAALVKGGYFYCQ